jgi:hypothetical protein
VLHVSRSLISSSSLLSSLRVVAFSILSRNILIHSSSGLSPGAGGSVGTVAEVVWVQARGSLRSRRLSFRGLSGEGDRLLLLLLPRAGVDEGLGRGVAASRDMAGVSRPAVVSAAGATGSPLVLRTGGIARVVVVSDESWLHR